MNKYMGKIILLVLCAFSLVEAFGQTSEGLEQQRKEFEQGRRDIDFLASYVAQLKEKNDVRTLSRVLDVYLPLLPEEQRYGEQGVADFIKYIDYQENGVCLDFIKNWDKLNLREEQVKQMASKMEVMLLWPVFHWLTSPEGEKPVKPDCADVLSLLKQSNVSAVSATCDTLLTMWQSYKQEDIDRMVTSFVGLLETGLTTEGGVMTIAVLGFYVNYLLEETDVQQAQRILSVVEKLLKDDSLERAKLAMLTDWKDDFTGKILLENQ